MDDQTTTPVEVEAGTYETLPSGDVIIGVPTAVAIVTIPTQEEE